jgi:hypothetical protein
LLRCAPTWSAGSDGVVRSVRVRGVAALTIFLAFALGYAAPSGAATGGGRVLPPQARVFGYSLSDMASETALFTFTENDPANYPDTPIQVLYADLNTFEATEVDGCTHVTLSNEFTTSVRTFYYVPILNNSDIPPLHGVFPTTAAESRAHFFGPNGFAGQYEVVVDGSATPVGPAFAVGPVAAPLESLGGSRVDTLGVFLAPLRPGTHTVVVRGTLTGPITQEAFGVECLSFEFTYTVHVVLPGG